MQDWILIRGLGRESGHWGALPKQIETHLPGSVVHCIDLPGAGEYRDIECPLSIEEMTEHLRQVARYKLGVIKFKKPYLLAISLGGMVATDWASRFWDELSGVVLMNPSFRGVSPLTDRLTPSGMKTLFRQPWIRDRWFAEAELLDLVSNVPAARAQALPVWASLARERPISALNAFKQLIAAARFHAPSLRPQIPTLILGGAKDRMVSPRCHERIAEIWNAKLERHPSAGHDLPLDAPDWVVDQLAQFVAQVEKDI
jgi:pimeloyl-ACP methyl ester carboxylesterase